MSQTTSRPYVHSDFFITHVVNPLTTWLGGPTLIVVGRRSGRPISTPVPPFRYHSARYLVSGGGETDWVRNLRAAGRGELRNGRKREVFQPVEVHRDEHDRVVTAYRARFGWRARNFFAALPRPGRSPGLPHRSARADRQPR